MIDRKKGETDKQFCKRLEAYSKFIEDNNRSLRILNADQNKANPRTGRTYQEEAQELFRTIALVELFIREGNAHNAIDMLMGQLSALGFNEVDIFTNQCIQDGAYDGKKVT